ncbi:hypothetical protein BC829DRAFT_237600 [Chytridium lagenaria]|nr:hypothetical protein BC829DRAFT_237600 [Chytridium lagenaria]
MLWLKLLKERIQLDIRKEIENYVAELILKESLESEDKYSKSGLDAYLDAEKRQRLPKPNLKFLASVVKSTSNHNKALLDQLRRDATDKLKRMEPLSSNKDKRDRKNRKDDSRHSCDRDVAKRKRTDTSLERDCSRADSREQLERKRLRADSRDHSERKHLRTNSRSRSPKPQHHKEDTDLGRASSPEGDEKEKPAHSSSAEPLKTFRGRGKVGPVRLDKLFTDGYIHV